MSPLGESQTSREGSRSPHWDCPVGPLTSLEAQMPGSGQGRPLDTPHWARPHLPPLFITYQWRVLGRELDHWDLSSRLQKMEAIPGSSTMIVVGSGL